MTKGITIVGPDTEVITKGLNVDSAVDMTTGLLVDECNFTLKAGTIILGPTVVGHAEERIRRPQYPVGTYQNDSGWQADDGTGGFIWMGGGFIYDKKFVNPTGDAFINAVIGASFDDFFQQNRLIIDDCRGGTLHFVIYYFPEHHFKRVKTGPVTWQLVEI